MNESELLKKKKKRKPISGPVGKAKKSTFPILAHIVLSNGSRVDIPKLPFNFSELTTYDHMRIAMEYAALATSCLEEAAQYMTREHMKSLNLAPIRLNLEDLMNHLYYAIQDYPKPTGSS